MAPKTRRQTKKQHADATMSTPSIENHEISVDQGACSDVSEQELHAVTASKHKRCRHFKPAFRSTKLMERLTRALSGNDCSRCAISEKVDSESSLDETQGEKPTPTTLWLCITCLHLHCGRDDCGHALNHHEEKKKHESGDGAHPVVINIQTLEVYCYECDRYLDANGDVQLVCELQKVLEKALHKKSMKERQKATTAALESQEDNSKSIRKAQKGQPKEKVHHVGLRNLGNTCFFNAVMQSLAACDTLGEACATAKEETMGPLNSAFAKLIDAMRTCSTSMVIPKPLHGLISQKWRQFRGFHQQDSHELLRYLLDGLQEEIKKASNAMESDNTTDYIQCIFGGKLASVVVCDICYTCSVSHETFLDLSLPIQQEANKHETMCKSASTKSKHAIKMEMKSKGKKTKQSYDRSNHEVDPIALAASLHDLSLQDDVVGPSKARDDLDVILDSMDIPIKPTKAQAEYVENLMNDRYAEVAGTDSILNCLRAFTFVEHLVDDNQFACGNCYRIHQKEHPIDVSMSPKHVLASPDDLLPESEPISLDQSHSELELDGELHVSDSSASSATVVEHSEDEIIEEVVVEGDVPRHDAIRSSPKLSSSQKVATILRDARKRFLIEDFPQVMVLHLKRFQQMGRRGTTSKIDAQVSFDEILDLGPFAKDFGRIARYRLFAVIEHGGGLHGGHYVAHVRSPSAKRDDERIWVYCSDATVRETSLDRVLGCQAYMLFYEQVKVE